MKLKEYQNIAVDRLISITKKLHNMSTILSGITPSGNKLHIGNYFGAVKPQIDLVNNSNNNEVFYFIADLHALTTVKSKEVLESNIINVILDYLALGLDYNKASFFRQSSVPAHSELAIILANYVGYGHMQRMHAFKDKLQKGADIDNINMGLFNYPILMAADILLYEPDYVPVGEDQRQHVEITRDIAQNLNNTYNLEILKLPEPLISKATGKVVGTDGVRKMSKSLGNTISIFDSPEIIRKQIFSVFTDPNRKKPTDPGKVEGNPIFIYHDLLNSDLDEVNDLKTRYREGKVGDVEVKEKLFIAHQKFFSEAIKNRANLEKNKNFVSETLANGTQRAKAKADRTLLKVLESIGL